MICHGRLSDTGVAPAIAGAAPPPTGNKKARRSFAEKTIDAFSGFLMDDFYSERIAAQEWPDAGLASRHQGGHHPAADLCSRVPCIVGCRCCLINLYVLLLAYMSEVPLGSFLKRVWVFIPIFTLIIVIPTLFNVVRPGDPLAGAAAIRQAITS